MIFESINFYIDTIQDNDLEEVLQIYNSNNQFLLNHMDVNKVTREWIIDELISAKKDGFQSCKIVEKTSRKKIGIVDFKLDEETYLSLLIIHNDFRGKGLGKKFLIDFEEYIKSLKGKCIRIDVVTNYDSCVPKFWSENGFIEYQGIELNWTGKILPAVTMKKYL